ncbi:MAG: 5'-3' exonuclease H3TH domain-containing protein [Kiritimatiellia bacterium]|nr:5'-3' exonuclease H3TH domain-containing protein [Kiritimatiellia bacterium]MDP6810563.1 5'-3' exonuclease H3TH domain-containing protein [Kiritimatiellia bacterium]
MSKPRRLLLVDGYGMVYRAFYAIPRMTNTAGEPTNAVFGCIRMLEHLRDHWGASHWAVVFDGGLPDERMELVADYKANRESMPDDLSLQLGFIDEYLEGAGITRICVEGEEADDVLAAMAARARDRVDRVLIATSDKDLLQAVETTVHVVPMSGKGPALDPGGVLEKTGVRPDQVVPWLAMIGDSADNIAGVPGVGKKTAASLLLTYGSLDGIREHLDELQGKKTGQSLAAHWERVERNVRMVRLNLDIPCDDDLESWAVRTPDASCLLTLYERLGFEQFAKNLREPELFAY